MSSSQDDRKPVTLPPITAFTKVMQDKEGSLGHPPGLDAGRDSGNWSMQSKHSSTISTNNPGSLHIHTILNNSANDEGSNRYSSSSIGTPASTRFPSGPTTSAGLPSLNQSYAGTYRDSVSDNNSVSFLDSRRSSLDSRNMTSNMSHLGLGGANSPYESANASQASLTSSLHNNLREQRGIHTPIQPKLSGPSSALSPGRRPQGRAPAPPRRIAPPIMSTHRTRDMPDPMASTPTKGFAWAFPDPAEKEEPEDSASPESSRHNSMAGNSIDNAASFTRFTDPLQHKTITSLQDHNAVGTGNYSRTPELRVSHKLAERKRRSEMKDLFDSLNRILPNSPGNKSSKWEILSKAIEFIQYLKQTQDLSQRDNEKLRSELERLRATADENQAISNEITAMYQQLLRVDPNGHHVFGPKTQHLVEQQGSGGQRLPPPPPPPGMHHGQPSNGWSQPSRGAMEGVEYGHNYERR